jgi:hypothetical protein
VSRLLCCVHSDSNVATALVAEGVFSFRTVQQHNSYKRADCISALFKTVFPDNEIAWKFWTAQAEIKTNSVIAPHAIENIMQVLKNDSVLLWSCHMCQQSQCCESVSCCNIVFWLENGGLQSKLIEVQQQSSEVAETVALYTKGILIF